MAVELLECVINVSEGRDHAVVAQVAAAGGSYLLDVHRDPDHHRSVFTLAGPATAVQLAARAVARATVDRIDLSGHRGVHPRFGVLDVVPFVALRRDPGGRGWLEPGDLSVAVGERDAFARWAATELDLPCFLYGPERSLPEVRRRAWRDLEPDLASRPSPHPTAGATAVGARPPLVAYNLWLARADLDLARSVANEIRGAGVRALGLPVGSGAQVSCNLVDPWRTGPGAVYDMVAERSIRAGLGVARAELVGLLPREVLEAQPVERWAELGLDETVTIEYRLERAGLAGS